MSYKKIIFMSLLSATLLVTEFNPNYSITETALILGCGVKHEPGPCNDLGYRVIEHKAMLFGFQLGDSWTTEVAC